MAITGLSTHKSRSLLTILGIVIGITSITLVTAIGNSTQNLILEQVQSFGTNNVAVIPGRHPTGFVDSASTILSDSLKQRDIEALEKKSNVPDAVRVIPIVIASQVATYENESYALTMLGGTSDLRDIYNLKFADGEFFADEDVAGQSGVVIIGQKVAKELFGNSNPIGQKIKIKDRSLRVIGLLAAKGQSSFINFDEVALAPYTTIQQYILGIKHVHRIIVEASSLEAVPGVKKDIERTLRDNHNITDPTKDDFFIETPADIAETLGVVTSALTLLLTSIAAISLVVGGVGIMNIMLVSVTERTREIGLRKALGATNANVLTQFLAEAVMLTATGGIIGVVLGTSLSFMITFVADKAYGLTLPFIWPLFGMVLGVSVSTLIGFVFGIYPARQAAKKSPMEALRYE